VDIRGPWHRNCLNSQRSLMPMVPMGKEFFIVKLGPRIFHTVKAVFSCLVSLLVLMYLISFIISLFGKRTSIELPLIWPVTIDSLTIDLGWVSIFVIILVVAGVRGWVTFDRTKQ